MKSQGYTLGFTEKSFHQGGFIQSIVAGCMPTDFMKWNSYVDIFSRKVMI